MPEEELATPHHIVPSQPRRQHGSPGGRPQDSDEDIITAPRIVPSQPKTTPGNTPKPGSPR
ncbi:hypothetical protein M407DRAFT_244325 [Tulasnella calospora MUT 4182]|uniref:Uncharacterized protein n=1 Tax=Tulasnella calospora MUT 4182 TaxID=1051891 RepID=A0A0C3QGU1_9AGAM|nr:hypothetical protein M407DRAFT_244325 [Tulasnella calospora MUT 4182]